ncbi:hypothetical protein HaLaN_23031 [Haematococcus lacustris]|uniref:Uncharacterized protein n=1 Tax=Haematococcus lacustris TaxID=44745 RepID=A0A699ZZ84_HAELA|nr:hypothetical protein HaLaN_23031 [Haematococcus lacustris]
MMVQRPQQAAPPHPPSTLEQTGLRSRQQGKTEMENRFLSGAETGVAYEDIDNDVDGVLDEHWRKEKARRQQQRHPPTAAPPATTDTLQHVANKGWRGAGHPSECPSECPPPSELSSAYA